MAAPLFPVFEFNIDNPFVNALNEMQQNVISKMLQIDSKTHPIEFHFPSSLERLDVEEEQINGFPEEHGQKIMQSKHFERKKLTMTLLVLSDKFEDVLPSKLFYIQRTQAQTTHSSDFIDETHFEPENLSLKDLQQLQPEPWSDLISDDNISVNTIYNTLSSIQLNPLPFQDPLKQYIFMLRPTDYMFDSPSEKIPFPSDMKMDSKRIDYPSPPKYDYLLEILQDKFQNETVNCSVEKEPNSLPSPDIADNQTVFTQVEVIESPQVQDNHTQGYGIVRDFVQMPLNIIELDLQGLPADLMLLLEQTLLSCWNSLMCMDLNPPMDQLKDYQSKLHQLHPQISRQFLSSLKEAFIQSKKDSTQFNYESHFKKILPVLLFFHGLNKTIDIYLNIDFEIAYQTFLDFTLTHRRELKGQCKPILIHLFHLIQNVKEAHPKLIELKLRVIEHLDEHEDRKVWIRLQRYAKEIGRKIQRILAEISIECALDPRIFDSDLLVYRPSEYERVFISDRMLEGFPFSFVSLIIDYEWPIKVLEPETHSTAIERVVLQVRRISDMKTLEAVQITKALEDAEDVIATEATKSEEDYKLLQCSPTTSEINIEEVVVESKSGQSEGLELIASSTLKRIHQLRNQLMSQSSIAVFEYDYSFLDASTVYQPDILVSWNLAVLVIPAEEFDDLKQIRLKVLMTSFKCNKCYIIVLGSSAWQLTGAPYFWNPLIGLIRFYEESRPEFLVRFRLAVNEEQVVSILTDLVVEEQHLGEIQPYHYFANYNQDARLLLYFPYFNAISAHIVLQKLNVVDLLTLPLETLREIIPSELLMEKIEAFRNSMNEPLSSTDSSVYVDECVSQLASSYGKLNVCWTDQMEPSVISQSPRSSKKLKLEEVESTASVFSSWHSTLAENETRPNELVELTYRFSNS